MKFIYPVLVALVFTASAGYAAEKEYVPTVGDKFDWAREDLETFGRQHIGADLNFYVIDEGNHCIPGFGAKYESKVVGYTDEILKASREVSETAGSEWGYNQANRPFIGALAGGSKSTKYMCEGGYDELRSLYQDRLAHYTEMHDLFLKHKEALAKNRAEAVKLFDRKALVKEASGGKCYFLNDLFSATKGLLATMDRTSSGIDDMMPWVEGHIVDAAKELNGAAEEQRKNCAGKKVRAGVEQNPGYANELEEHPVEVPSGL